MNKLLITIFYFVFSLATIHCADAQSTSLIGFDTVDIHKLAGPCINNDSSFCCSIEVSYPRAITGDTNNQKLLNHFITRKIIGYLLTKYDSIPNFNKINSMDEAIKLKIKKILKEQHISNEWKIDLSASVVFEDENYITLYFEDFEEKNDDEEFNHYYTFNKNNFTQLNISAIVTDTNKLNTIGEYLFRKMENISLKTPLADSDYFYRETFHLPNNLGILKDTLIFLYQELEIAPHADGYIELNIPFTAITDILKEPFKHEVQQEK